MSSSSLRRSIPTVDRISDLPDSILCHILSFVPTKLAATTIVLSKRWKQVWLSVLALHYDQESFKNFNSFRNFISLTMSLRDKEIPIHSFTFKAADPCCRLSQRDYDRIFKIVMKRGVENLTFSNKIGCPILEDLDTKEIVLKKSLGQLENLNALPNLAKLRIRYYCSYIPMILVCKTKSLHVEKSLGSLTMLPIFHNLTHMELEIHDKFRVCTWLLGILPHFPKLQHFIIQDCGVKNTFNVCWKHPPSVPECLSWQLKTCCIRGYIGTKHQLEFAKYIMQHSEVLETMKIQSTYPEKDQMLLKLSSCTRGSTACKLLFD